MKNTVSLKSNDLFLRAYRKGKRAYHKFYTLHYLPNGLPVNRLGLSVGKKCGKAVVRNRIRRLVRESYRLSEARVKRGYDLVFAAREDASRAGAFDAANRAVFKLLQSADLFKKNAGTGGPERAEKGGLS
jgi:ribonuclease P protein component